MNSSTSTQPFTYYLRVRYSECDMQKVVFNAKYGEFADIAATEYMRVLWGAYDEVFAAGIDNQVVSLTINWRAPAKFDDVVAIEVFTAHVGNTSYSLEMRMLNHKHHKVLAEAKVTYVMIDAHAQTKKRIPKTMREAFNQGALDQYVNHAGVNFDER